MKIAEVMCPHNLRNFQWKSLNERDHKIYTVKKVVGYRVNLFFPTWKVVPGAYSDQNYLGVNLWWFYFVSRTSRSQYICVFRRSEWKWLKEQKWKSSQNLQFRARFCRNCKFLFSYMESGHGGIFWPFCEKLWTVEHPERVVSFKKEAERGWKSGVTLLSWKSGWKPWTIREFWHQRI